MLRLRGFWAVNFVYLCSMKGVRRLPTPEINDISIKMKDNMDNNASEAEVKNAACDSELADEKNADVEKVKNDAGEVMRITERAIELLRTVYDPEIPVNVYDLGLIYKIDYEPDTKTLHVEMTLTAPGCPAADFIMEDVRQKLMSVEGPQKVDLRLVFEPVWTQDMMSEEAKLELGFM